MASAALSPAQQQQQLIQQNALARALILANSIPRVQQISSTTQNAANNSLFQIIPLNVGLIKGFFVEVTATINNTNVGASGAAITPTKLGAANILSNIQFQDLQNQTRINTTGWHLHFLNSVRSGRPYGQTMAFQSSPPVAYGNNFAGTAMTQSIAAGASGTITMLYYVPLAYGAEDLRGAVFANVVASSMSLQLQINTAAVVNAGSDATNACYSGNTGTVTNCTVTVYQSYLDQIPVSQDGGIVLPYQDLSTIYDIKNTTMTGLTAGADFGVPYANLRDFLSTFAIYDNAGVLNAGTDINNFACQSANQTTFWRYSPTEAALRARMAIGLDFPNAVYYFDSRGKPISTIQTGNTQFIVNPSAVTAGATLLLGFEAFSYMNVVAQAGSLPSG